jgi:hypothetical protein
MAIGNSLIRIAPLMADDLAYPAGARWAVMTLKWNLTREVPGGEIVGAKVRSLEEAVALASRAVWDTALIDRATVLRFDPAALDTIEHHQEMLAFYRQRRAAGHVPEPPASWNDIFLNPEAAHA